MCIILYLCAHRTSNAFVLNMKHAIFEETMPAHTHTHPETPVTVIAAYIPIFPYLLVSGFCSSLQMHIQIWLLMAQNNSVNSFQLFAGLLRSDVMEGTNACCS